MPLIAVSDSVISSATCRMAEMRAIALFASSPPISPPAPVPGVPPIALNMSAAGPLVACEMSLIRSSW